MKFILTTVAVAASVYAISLLTNRSLVNRDTLTTPVFKEATAFEPVAVLELFTSQGCSSCPSADRLLEKTVMNANGKKIYALSFHVDYWNRLGWKDPFSRHAFSLRQGMYASRFGEGPYTPQLVVNGTTQFVGSDQGDLRHAIAAALTGSSAVVFSALKLKGNGPGAPEIEYELEGSFEDCSINFALISLKETTNIQRGENEGVTLTNAHVTRQLITAPAKKAGKISFQDAPVPADNNRAVVAFIQQNKGGKIIGAAEVR